MLWSDKFRDRKGGFFNDNREWIRMDRVNVALKRGRDGGQFRCQDFYLGRVKMIDETTNVSGEIVMDAMNVLTHVHTAATNMGQHFLQGDDLLLGTVAPIIDHDV